MRVTKKYHGVVVPMVTPLTQDLSLDENAAQQLLQKMQGANVQAFILGTTGEAASLPWAVKKKYISIAGAAPRSGHLYVGISSNVFDESVAMAELAADAGADVVVATVPSYYALTTQQTEQYFSDLAAKSPLPLIIYNIPATTHVSLPLDMIDALSVHPNIVGLKDSERSEVRLTESLKRWRDRTDFSHFVGWAAKSASALLLGSDGIIPSTGNLEADFYADLYQAALNGKEEIAYMHQRYSDALGAVYQNGKTLGESLWALKVLLSGEGIGTPVVMPPLQSLTDETAKEVLQSYQKTRR